MRAGYEEFDQRIAVDTHSDERNEWDRFGVEPIAQQCRLHYSGDGDVDEHGWNDTRWRALLYQYLPRFRAAKRRRSRPVALVACDDPPARSISRRIRNGTTYLDD